jgi:hypothetical protein
MERPNRKNTRRAVWGVLLMAVGIFFFLGQVGLVSVMRLGHWWPLIIVMIGLVRLVAPDSRKQFAAGLSFVLFGLWFFACTRHWWGLTWANSWPLALVICGSKIVLVAALDRLNIGPEGKEQHRA